MTDSISRLNAALEGRYRVEREIGEGGICFFWGIVENGDPPGRYREADFGTRPTP